MLTITDFLNKYSVLTSVNSDAILPHMKLSLTLRQYILLHKETENLLNGSENFDQKIANVFLKLLNKFNYLILTGDINDPVSLEHYRGQELELININYDQLNGHSKLFTGLKTLICSKCLIPSLEDIICFGKRNLQEYKLLKYVQLNSCQLRKIDNSMALLKNLTSLNLSRNKLKEFNITQLTLTNLKNLDLSFNFLTSLNFIQINIESNIDVKPLENLKCLYVQNNHISSLKGIEKFERLQILDANNNLISIPNNTIFLKRLKKLVQLNLNNNPIIFQKNYRENLIKNLHASAAAQFSLDGKDLTTGEKSMKMNENFDIYDPSIDYLISRSSVFESLELPLPLNSNNMQYDNGIVNSNLGEISNNLTTPATLSAARIRAFLASDTYSDYHTGSIDTNTNTDNSMENCDFPIAQNLLVKKSKNKQSTNSEMNESFNQLENSKDLKKDDKLINKNMNNKSINTLNKVDKGNVAVNEINFNKEKVNGSNILDEIYTDKRSMKSNKNDDQIKLIKDNIIEEAADIKITNSSLLNASCNKDSEKYIVAINNDLDSLNLKSNNEVNNEEMDESLLNIDAPQYIQKMSNLLNTNIPLNKAEKKKLKNNILTSVDIHPPINDSLTLTEIEIINEKNLYAKDAEDLTKSKNDKNVVKIVNETLNITSDKIITDETNSNQLTNINESTNNLLAIESIYELPYTFNISEFTRNLDNIENICIFSNKRTILFDYDEVNQCLEFEQSIIESEKSLEKSDIDEEYGAREILCDIEKRLCYSIKILNCDSSLNNDSSLCTVGNHWLYFFDEYGKVSEKFDLRSLKKATLEDIKEREKMDNAIGHDKEILKESEVMIKLIFNTLKQSRKKKVLIMQNLFEAQDLLEVVNSFIKIVVGPKVMFI